MAGRAYGAVADDLAKRCVRDELAGRGRGPRFEPAEQFDNPLNPIARLISFVAVQEPHSAPAQRVECEQPRFPLSPRIIEQSAVSQQISPR